MSNRAKNSKESIICDTKELMKLYDRLTAKGVTLNEKKFYDQPATKGCEFLGSHIRPNRIHINNKTYDNANRSIEKLNDSRYKDIDGMVSTFNSYSGLLKNRTDYKRLIELKDKLLPVWWQWLEWDERRLCITYKKGFTTNERLNSKYNLNLKRKNYEKRRNQLAA